MRVCVRCAGPVRPGSWICPSCSFAPEEREFLVFATDPRGEALSASSLRDVAEVEGSSFWFRSRERLISWALGRYFPGPRSFLDVGCGTGAVLAWLRASTPGLDVVGADLAIEGLPAARERLPGVPL